MAQHSFNHMGGGGGVNPNDLAYGSSFQNNFGSSHTNGFTGGSGGFQDDELLESLGTPTEQSHGMHGADFGSMDGLSVPQYAQGIYSPATQSISLDQNHINGFSNTPEGDPIQSPYVHNFPQYRQMQNPQAFGSIHSPGSYTNTDRSARMPTAMQRKISSNRSPLTPGSAPRPGMPLSSDSFGAQPIRTNGSHHEKTNSGQWIQTPNSVSSFAGSGGLSSPMQNMHSAQHLDFLMKNGGASLPAKIGTNMTPSQEAKRKRRRESHNLVERRRRDNINERIQDLSKLVPTHRLEDEKMKKLISSGTPLSPTLAGISSPSQATSALAGPGAKRATGGTAGNITTGLPIEDKDKGPNKGDILNGAVSWTRDLMWLLNVHISRQEELLEWFSDRGEQPPFTITNDERRMTSELINAMRMPELTESEKKLFVYSRTNGTGLRVPDHTDYKGDPLEGTGVDPASSVSPDAVNEFVDQGQFEQNPHWDYDNDSGELDIREEDEFMDLN